MRKRIAGKNSPHSGTTGKTAIRKQGGKGIVCMTTSPLMAKLGIKEKYLKKLRDNGYLGYSREGDKYWYTQEDVDRFLRHFHFDAFAIGIDLPKQEGGGYV